MLDKTQYYTLLILIIYLIKNLLNKVRRRSSVRIHGSHPWERGSTPRAGVFFFLSLTYKITKININEKTL